MAILVDTSAIVALANASDPRHDAVRTAFAAATEPFIIPLPVLPEIDYLIQREAGTDAALIVMDTLVRGNMVIDHLMHADLVRANEPMRMYADTYIGFVDSSIIALAERLNIRRILTLDRRHFAFVRPRHCAAFDLLP